jgi:hypothetical protein
MLLVLAAWQAAAQLQVLAEAQQALRSITVTSPALPAATPASKSTPTRAASRSLHEQALVSLHRPWLPLLDGLERSANMPVAWRQWSVDAGFQRLNLEVEARALPEVFAYVTELQRTAQDEPLLPVASVQLISHDWQTASAAASAPPTVRARVAATLRVPAAGASAGDRMAPDTVHTASRSAQTPALEHAQ